MANDKQVIVLGVKILSFRKNHVNAAKTMFPTPKPTSFDVHSCPEASTVFLTAYQNIIPAGTAKIEFIKIGRSLNHSQVNCELYWNHAKMFAAIKNNIPIFILVHHYRI